jgi:2-polyprenyl-3-methyl-5-hydroxy-6-metoxy-1,4-benzoquinol methylase
MLIKEKPSLLMESFLKDYNSLYDIDIDKAKHYIKTNIHFDHLTDKWYDDLLKYELDVAYQVYNDDYYFTDMWNCFATYSRRYLRDISKACMPNGQSFVELTSDSKIVVDIGCGIGYSTSSLTELYPNATVYGTNLKNTKQWTFCNLMSKRYGFNMIEDVSEIDSTVDIIFASEYFEHFLDPIEHFNEICRKVSPKYFVIANAFNTKSIGHFITYKVNNIDIDQKFISRMFNKNIRSKGYSRVETKLFNNKPNIWKKQDTQSINDYFK